MVRLDELFNLSTGVDISKVEVVNKSHKDAIPYIRPTAYLSNIISDWVNLQKIDFNLKVKSGSIVVANRGQGSHTYAHIVPFDCIASNNVTVLVEKVPMSIKEKLYYAQCITMNRFKFSYGRSPVLGRFGELTLPSKEEIPSWVYEMELPKYEVINGRHTEEPTPSLDVEKWGSFKYSDLFDISVGTTLSKDVEEGGTTPYISASGQNNGVLSYVKSGGKKLEGGAITVPIVGNSVAIAGYQENEFVLSNNAIALRLKNKDLNNYIALFLITIIRMESYRYGYGRKWGLNRMVDSIIKLPITKEGTPDWEFMEKYIKTLKYSKEL